MKLFILSALLCVACMNAHPGAVDITQNDCQTCHQADFQMAMGDPTVPHPPGWAGTCAACHTTQAPAGCSSSSTTLACWPFVHPSDPFPTMTGKHAPFFTAPFATNPYCHECHDSTVSNDFLANIDCYTACHNPNATGMGATTDSKRVHDGDSGHKACFDCHPDGRAHGG